MYINGVRKHKKSDTTKQTGTDYSNTLLQNEHYNKNQNWCTIIKTYSIEQVM